MNLSSQSVKYSNIIIIIFFLVLISIYSVPGEVNAETAVEDIQAFQKATRNRQLGMDEYEEAVSSIVKAIDSKWGTNYAGELPKAIKDRAMGIGSDVNSQIIAKGLIHIAYMGLIDQLNTLGKSPDTPKKVLAYFECIRPVLKRRAKTHFNGKNVLEQIADSALERMSKTGTMDLMTRRQFDDVIARAFALSVLYEYGELVKKRDIDPGFCDIKRAEGSVYYRNLEPRIKKHNPRANEIILNMINGSNETIDIGILEENLTAGLGIKLRP